VFGRIGDLVGRKFIFPVTVTPMDLGTFLIALPPSFASVGFTAPAEPRPGDRPNRRSVLRSRSFQ
jgi:MFS family permease